MLMYSVITEIFKQICFMYIKSNVLLLRIVENNSWFVGDIFWNVACHKYFLKSCRIEFSDFRRPWAQFFLFYIWDTIFSVHTISWSPHNRWDLLAIAMFAFSYENIRFNDIFVLYTLNGVLCKCTKPAEKTGLRQRVNTEIVPYIHTYQEHDVNEKSDKLKE